MPKAWVTIRQVAFAATAILAGCARPDGSGDASRIASDSGAAGESCSEVVAREPARFEAPPSDKLRRVETAVETAGETWSGDVKAISNEEDEKAPVSVLVNRPKQARRDEPNAPRPLPMREQRAKGDIDAVTQRVGRLIGQAYGLADRGALYSARSDLMTALQVLCESMDAERGGRESTDALASAMIALDEANDFVATGDARINLKGIVSGHQTPALKKANFESVTSILAMQRYYTYAQQQLIIAANGSPAASDALCGLGKIARHLPVTETAKRRNALVQSLVYQQSAVSANPKNYHAANELGSVYEELDRPELAKQIFLDVAQATQWPGAWSNLASVHTKLKEYDLAELAMRESHLAQRAPQMKVAPPRDGSKFQWVSPEQFIAEGPDDAPQVLARRGQNAGGRK